MKNRGIIISIVLIIVCGVVITNGTRHFVSDGKEPAPTEAAMQSAPVPAAGARADAVQEQSDAEEYDGVAKDELSSERSEATAAMAREEAFALEYEMAADTAYDIASKEKEAREAPSAVISPLTGSAPSSAAAALTAEDYERRFNEADSRIARIRESGVVPSTDTCKNMAEYEYRLWDSELNIIYQDILKGMNEAEAEKLRGEEREWLKLRDETARKAASKYAGGSIESMEYTASLAVSTRERAYRLLEDYKAYLPAPALAETAEGNGLN